MSDAGYRLCWRVENMAPGVFFTMPHRSAENAEVDRLEMLTEDYVTEAWVEVAEWRLPDSEDPLKSLSTQVKHAAHLLAESRAERDALAAQLDQYRAWLLDQVGRERKGSESARRLKLSASAEAARRSAEAYELAIKRLDEITGKGE